LANGPPLLPAEGCYTSGAGFSGAKHIPPSNIPIERDLLDCSFACHARAKGYFLVPELNALTA
jgi:hypothetical protein